MRRKRRVGPVSIHLTGWGTGAGKQRETYCVLYLTSAQYELAIGLRQEVLYKW